MKGYVSWPDFLQPAFLSFHNLLIINIIYNIYNNSIMIKKKKER